MDLIVTVSFKVGPSLSKLPSPLECSPTKNPKKQFVTPFPEKILINALYEKLTQDNISNLRLEVNRPQQSIDLLRKSMEWFLYDNGLRLERVKKLSLTN